MAHLLGYITADDRLALYEPRMVADCLGISADKVFCRGGVCFGGWEKVGDGGVVCAFSGTLLNRDALSREFEARGGAAAICLAMYRAMGKGFARRLDGPFAALVYDGTDHCLRLYRDQLGQLPLFYAVLPNGTTLFADDLNLLLRMPGCPSALDLKSLADFLSLGYVPAPETIYSGIRKLEPGNYLTLRLGRGIPAARRYWQPRFEPTQSLPLAEAAAETREVIGGAMARILAAEPKCGVLLSGGIDSNLVAAYTTGAETYTAGFDDGRYDERPLAARSAAALKLNNTPVEVVPLDWQMLGQLQALNGEPFGDSSVIPTAVAMNLAWQHDTGCVLTGAGGDEIFGGYRRYQAMALRRLLGLAVPTGLQRLLADLALKALPAQRDGRTRLATLRRMAAFLRMDPLAGYASFQEIFSRDLKRELLRDSRIREQHSYLNEFAGRLEGGTAAKFWETFNELDVLGYLPDDGCAKERLAGASAGVRHLSPLLDLDVVELGLRLPAQLRLTLFHRKRVLRAAARGMILPELFRQGKRGFGMPVSGWFRGPHAGTARALSEDLHDWDEQGWFDGDAVARLVEEHVLGIADHGSRLWILLCLKKWLKGRRHA